MMQDKYVGDIGDFGKYGLLKALCVPDKRDGGPKLSLGVVWYLVPDDDRKGDGSLTQFPSLENCDPLLFKQLRQIVDGPERSVASVREKGVLPPGTAFYEEKLTFEDMPGIGPAARKKRIEHRTNWMEGAFREMNGCNVVFLDPDNGLEVISTRRHHKRGPKYVFYDEIARFLERGRSVIVIHHAGRRKNQTVKKQTQALLDKIRTKIRGAGSTFALRYHRGAPVRVFFVIPAKRDQDILLSRAEQLTQGAWSGRFSLVDP